VSRAGTNGNGADVVDDRTLGVLQDLLLEHVLTSVALPGRTAPLSFPDLEYVLQSDERLLLGDGYCGASERVTVVDSIVGRATDGPTGFLHFESPQEEAGRVTLRLRVLLAFPDAEPLPLGELIATFAPKGTGWTTVEPTHALAF
jgi:hypothetical protein